MRRGVALLAMVIALLPGCSGGSATTTTGTPAPVASVALSAPSVSLAPAATYQFTAVTRDASGNVLSDRTVTWTSTAPAVATVSTTGLVTAVAAGTATISATSGGKSASATVTVTVPVVPVASVVVTPAATTLTPAALLQLNASTLDGSGNPLNGRAITWSSSASTVASVSSSGMVTAVAVGAATITATSEGKSGSATITVVAGVMIGAAGGTAISPDGNASVVIPAGALTQLTPISIAPASGTPAFANVISGTAYDFEPSGTQFSVPVTIKLKYDPANNVAGIPQGAIQLNTVVAGAWMPIAGTHVDTVAHLVQAQVAHFSGYSLVAEPLVFKDDLFTSGDPTAGGTAAPRFNLTVCVGGSNAETVAGVVPFSSPQMIVDPPDPAIATETLGADGVTFTVNGVAVGSTYLFVIYYIGPAQSLQHVSASIEISVIACDAAAHVPVYASVHNGVSASDNVFEYTGSGLPQALTTTGQARYPAAGTAPDGTSLIGFRYLLTTTAQDVYWHGPGGAVTPIGLPSTSIPNSAGAFTASQAFIFASPIGLTADIWGVPFGGTTISQLTNFGGNVSDIAVAPDGTAYVAFRGPTGPTHIYTTPLPAIGSQPITTGLIPVTSGTQIELHPSISQNGSWLVYEQNDPGFTFARIMLQSTVPGSIPTVISPPTGYAFVPQWCGNLFVYWAYSTSFGGSYSLIRYNAALNTATPVPAFAGLAINEFAIPRTDGDHGLDVCP